jgi:hypothetical protein
LRGQFFSRRKSGVVFSILGILLILVALAAVYFWEARGREYFLYREVVVTNQGIEANAIVTPDMLDIKKISPDNFMEGAVVDKNEVEGKYSTHYIPKYSQLSLAYFKDNILDTEEEDYYIFTVPAEWIITFPGSLRRGDTVYFYPVKIAGNQGEQAKSTGNLQSIKNTKERGLVKCRVAYLKDSGNREVVDTEGLKRHDGSANIVSIEIITGYEDMVYLEGLAESSFKFIVLYKSSAN